MIVLSVEDLRKHFGPEPVLDGVTFEVRPGERIGLAGPNGSGKTTLLKILAGKEEGDAGRWELHASARLGYLEQQPEFAPERTLWDEARDALGPLIALQNEAIQTAEKLGKTDNEDEHRRLAARYDHLQQELHRHDAYNLDHKIERVLDGLGFAKDRLAMPVRALSGGEQNRLILAKLLVAEPDVMLLDEPSNHLDIEATEWLEDFLIKSPAALIVVSHDRYFLDKVTTRTLELFRGTVDSYAGNFSAYWRQKAERLLVEKRTYEKQQTEIAKTEDFIRRNAYGQKHAQAEDRRKKLARIRRVPPPREIEVPPMRFPKTSRSGDIVLRAERLAKQYDSRVLFKDASFEIQRGERWGILGPNGCGKTTLLRAILGRITLDAGSVRLGHGVEIAYFDQQLATLDDNASVVDCIRPDTKDFELQKRRDLLARFGVKGDTALQPAGSLSGGERCRAALARLAATEANLLVLDEPTNHLDLWAREALEQALAEFEGTVLFVSHDRYFMNRLADHLLVFEPERIRAFEGNYDAFLRVANREENAAPETPRPASLKAETRNRDGTGERRGNQRKKRRFPYRKVDELEAEIFEREGRLETLHEELALPETHRDGDQVRRLKSQIDAQQAALETLYEHWEEATELNW